MSWFTKLGSAVLGAIPGGSALDNAFDWGDLGDWIPGIGDDDPVQAPPSGNGVLGPGCNIQLVVPGKVRPVHTCPPGYVTVQNSNGVKSCMLKPHARMCGLWKPKRKPPISASDYRTIRRAASAQKRLSRVVKMADKATGRKIVKTCTRPHVKKRR